MPGLVGLSTPVAHRHKRIACWRPGASVPDGDGGYTQTLVPLSPAEVFGAIRPASVRDLERLTAGTVISQATHIVSMPFHPEITTETELRVEDFPNVDRRFSVVAVLNPNERDVESLLVCTELVP